MLSWIQCVIRMSVDGVAAYPGSGLGWCWPLSTASCQRVSSGCSRLLIFGRNPFARSLCPVMTTWTVRTFGFALVITTRPISDSISTTC